MMMREKLLGERKASRFQQGKDNQAKVVNREQKRVENSKSCEATDYAYARITL